MKIEITSSEIKDHLGVQVNMINSLFSRPDPFLAPCMIEKLKQANALPLEIEREENRLIFSRLHRFIDCIAATRETISIYTGQKIVEVTAQDLKVHISRRYPDLKFDENLAGLLLSQCSSTIEDFLKKALKKEGRGTFSGLRAKRPFMLQNIKSVLVTPAKVEIYM